MRIAPRWIDRNLTRLELTVSVTILALFIGVFIQRGLVVMANAERTMLKTTVNNIRTGLKHRAIIARLADDESFFARLEDINPLVELEVPTSNMNDNIKEPGYRALMTYSSGVLNVSTNYLGEFAANGAMQYQPGAWYYDRTSGELVYFVRNTEYFVSQGGKPDRIRFKTIVEYDDIDADGEYTPGVDRFFSVDFRSSARYEWKM